MEILFCLLCAFLGGITGFIAGACFAEGNALKQAIKAGVGEYFINDRNEKEFRWKQPK